MEPKTIYLSSSFKKVKLETGSTSHELKRKILYTLYAICYDLHFIIFFFLFEQYFHFIIIYSVKTRFYFAE